MLVVIASAVYMLWMFQRAFFAVPSDWMRRAWNGLHDLTRLEWASLAPLVILVVLLGVYPAPILDATAGSVERILESVETAAGLDLTAFWPW
jgi:NADH-quinone oxidoreductase subunit M